MGVASFFRWLSMKYPKCIVYAQEEHPIMIGGEFTEIDIAAPNPNGEEYDNLYLDMNGIVHNCSHSSDLDVIPATEEDMFQNMFLYVDRLMSIVRPRKLLFIAIDGVAPRAKMNQQRSRRFRSVQEAEESNRIESDFRQELKNNNQYIPEKHPSSWDSNIITPGTSFMKTLSEHMRWYIHDRITNHKGWDKIKVILSDSSVPGEGEHKIIEYIRIQRQQKNYNPNTHHVIHGLDADLIMLGLATHEVHFSILREEVLFGQQVLQCYLCGSTGHRADECKGKYRKQYGVLDWNSRYLNSKLQFVHLSILREYFEAEFYGMSNEIRNDDKYTIERILDDFVFLCFFCGNDFLPHLPALDLRQGAIGLLMNIYKNIRPRLNGYLTDCGKIDLERLSEFIREVAKYEDALLKAQRTDEDDQRSRRIERKMKLERKKKEGIYYSDQQIQEENEKRKKEFNENYENEEKERVASQIIDDLKQRNMVREYDKLLQERIQQQQTIDDIKDEIEYGEPGWKEKYYKNKFKLLAIDPQFKSKLVSSYIHGLCWVLLYYYQGCPSWSWFFPYHYSPCASDLIDIKNIKIEFNIGEPYKPLEQLMAVLPPASSSMLPKCYADLMTNPKSPIYSYYPTDFKTDPNGHPQKWLWVVLLPFIKERKLLECLRPLDHLLNEDEKERNSFSKPLLFFHESFELAEVIKKKQKITLGFISFNDMKDIFGGYTAHKYSHIVGDSINAPNKRFNDILYTRCCDVGYILPERKDHKSVLLRGVNIPQCVLLAEDLRITEPSLSRTISIAGLCKPPSWVNNIPVNMKAGYQSWGTFEPRISEKQLNNMSHYEAFKRQRENEYSNVNYNNNNKRMRCDNSNPFYHPVQYTQQQTHQYQSSPPQQQQQYQSSYFSFSSYKSTTNSNDNNEQQQQQQQYSTFNNLHFNNYHNNYYIKKN